MSSQRLGSRQAPNLSAHFQEVCSVRFGQAHFGVPIRHVLEIVGAGRPQPVPLAPAFVGGLVHYRGDVLTAVSLRHVLGLPAIDKTQAILVIESPNGAFGLLVDSVGEVLNLSSVDFEPNPSTIDPSRKELFAGAYKLKDNLLVMLRPERLDPSCLGAVLA